MKAEYDLANMKNRPNPDAKQLNQVTLPLGIEVKYQSVLKMID